MFRKIKYGKIVIVVSLTILIWVWADLALDETTDKAAVLVVKEPTDPSLWVSFRQARSQSFRLTLAGPHSAIGRMSKGEIEFAFDAAAEQMDKPGGYSLNLLQFLQRDTTLRRLGLKLKSCEPQVVDVNVAALRQKTLAVECLDESGNLLKAAVDPSTVQLSAPEERRSAQVRLSRAEIERARTATVEKRPFVVLGVGQTREATRLVKIKMPPAEDPRNPDTVTTARLGIATSLTLKEKYKVNVKNLNEVIGLINIRATPAAKQAFEAMRYQVVLEIDDGDVNEEEELRREVRYNFPEDFVRKDEIRLNQSPARAWFELTPRAPGGE
jgi:hypothetical protein